MSIFKNIIKNILNTVEQIKDEVEKPAADQNPYAAPQQDPYTPPAQTIPNGYVVPNTSDRPSESVYSGDSWGDTMPAAENQFNYLGPYQQYFETVFRENFPDFEVVRQDCDNRDASIFTFWKNEERALVVEVMSGTSKAQKVRKNCRANGVPYLRYYHNHYGWWNTKDYVIRRTRAALKI